MAPDRTATDPARLDGMPAGRSLFALTQTTKSVRGPQLPGRDTAGEGQAADGRRSHASVTACKLTFLTGARSQRAMPDKLLWKGSAERRTGFSVLRHARVHGVHRPYSLTSIVQAYRKASFLHMLDGTQGHHDSSSSGKLAFGEGIQRIVAPQSSDPLDPRAHLSVDREAVKHAGVQQVAGGALESRRQRAVVPQRGVPPDQPAVVRTLLAVLLLAKEWRLNTRAALSLAAHRLSSQNPPRFMLVFRSDNNHSTFTIQFPTHFCNAPPRTEYGWTDDEKRLPHLLRCEILYNMRKLHSSMQCSPEKPAARRGTRRRWWRTARRQ